MKVGDLVEIRGPITKINQTPLFKQLEVDLGEHQVWVREDQAAPSTDPAELLSTIADREAEIKKLRHENDELRRQLTPKTTPPVVP